MSNCLPSDPKIAGCARPDRDREDSAELCNSSYNVIVLRGRVPHIWLAERAGMNGKRLSQQRAGLPKMLRLDADLFPRYVRGNWRPRGFRVTKDEMTGTRVRAFACKIAALLIATATAGLFSVLAAPAASAATPTPQLLGYCGGDDWEPAMAAEIGRAHV